MPHTITCERQFLRLTTKRRIIIKKNALPSHKDCYSSRHNKYHSILTIREFSGQPATHTLTLKMNGVWDVTPKEKLCKRAFLNGLCTWRGADFNQCMICWGLMTEWIKWRYGTWTLANWRFKSAKRVRTNVLDHFGLV